MGRDLIVPPQEIDNSYLDYAVYKMFTIDLVNLIQIEVAMCKQFHFSPFELEKLPMWQYEIFMECMNKSVKEENDATQKQMDQYDIKGMTKMASNPQSMMPKMPTGNFNINMGNFNMPKI